MLSNKGKGVPPTKRRGPPDIKQSSERSQIITLSFHSCPHPHTSRHLSLLRIWLKALVFHVQKLMHAYTRSEGKQCANVTALSMHRLNWIEASGATKEQSRCSWHGAEQVLMTLSQQWRRRSHTPRLLPYTTSLHGSAVRIGPLSCAPATIKFTCVKGDVDTETIICTLKHDIVFVSCERLSSGVTSN
jgi:hypothetical protein